MANTQGTIEFYHVYGQDFVRAPNGDMMLVADAPLPPNSLINQPTTQGGVALATEQRLTRLFFNTPIIYDAYGNPLNVPDDMFNPTAGLGVLAMVDELDDVAATFIRNQANAQIPLDPAVAGPPALTFETDPAGDLLVSVAVETTSGTLATPSISLAAVINTGTGI